MNEESDQLLLLRSKAAIEQLQSALRDAHAQHQQATQQHAAAAQLLQHQLDQASAEAADLRQQLSTERDTTRQLESELQAAQRDAHAQEQRAAAAHDAADVAAKEAAQWQARDEGHVRELQAMQQERNQARESVASYIERNRVLLQAKQEAEAHASKLQDELAEARRLHEQAMEDLAARFQARFDDQEAARAREAEAVVALTDKLAALAALLAKAEEKRVWLSKQLRGLAVLATRSVGRPYTTR